MRTRIAMSTADDTVLKGMYSAWQWSGFIKALKYWIAGANDGKPEYFRSILLNVTNVCYLLRWK